MKVDLKKYMETRDRIREYESTPGPVITISREFGCMATPIAQKLVTQIAERSNAKTNRNWRIVSKEILEEAAQELEVSPLKVESVLDAKDVSAVSRMFSSFSSYYGVSDQKVLETLREIVNVYALEGKTIIVGRGGAFLTQRITNGVHIKIQAPFSWRVQQIQSRRDLAFPEAKALVASMDEKRRVWIENLSEHTADDSVYDVIFNRMSMTDDMIIDTTMALLLNKQLIADDIRNEQLLAH